MVRLKAAGLMFDLVNNQFQFHHGAIKRSDQQMRPDFKYYFNSIMVRLKVEIDIDTLCVSIFQFHHGAIKSNRKW